MKSKHKALLLSVCVVLLVTVSIFGTLAYLTDSEAVTNTFTVGSVGLTLDEAHVNEQGKPLKSNAIVEKVEDADRWQPSAQDPAQEYYLLPGHTYTKDPTVTVDAGSEEAYIRMMVTVSFETALTDEELATSLDSIFTGYGAAKWIRHAKTVSADGKSIEYEYRYHTTMDGKNDAGENAAEKLEPLFTGFTVPGEYDNEQMALLDGMKINVVAHAIQAAGFDDADEAWAAFATQLANNPNA